MNIDEFRRKWGTITVPLVLRTIADTQPLTQAQKDLLYEMALDLERMLERK